MKARSCPHIHGLTLLALLAACAPLPDKDAVFDRDGDGWDDVPIGALQQDSGTTGSGAAYLLYGGGQHLEGGLN